MTIDAVGVLVEGEEKDVIANAWPLNKGRGSTVRIELRASSYATVETEAVHGGTASITPPGTNGNITALPLLAAGNLHQLPGSPTIDRGAVDGASDALDVDGQPRTMGGAPDIGADELGSPPPRPIRAYHPARRAHPLGPESETVRPSSLRLERAWIALRMQARPQALPRLHLPVREESQAGEAQFQVRAVDPLGLVDPTPGRPLAGLGLVGSSALGQEVGAPRERARPAAGVATLAWRSVLTSIRPVPAARASGSSASDRAAVGEVEESGGLRGADAAGGAEQRLELIAGQRLLLGEEVEDAAAVVVDDDDADRGGDVAQGGEAADVVEQAEVAGDDRRRPAAGVGGADAGGDQAVDPVGATVAEEEGVGVVSGRGRPPGRGSACWRRCRRGRRRGGRRRGRGEGGLGDRPLAGRAPRSSDRLRGHARPRANSLARRPRFPLQPRRPARRQLGRVGAQDRRGAVARLVPAAVGVDRRFRSAPLAASQARSGLLVGISPKRRTKSGTTERAKRSSRSSRS